MNDDNTNLTTDKFKAFIDSLDAPDLDQQKARVWPHVDLGINAAQSIEAQQRAQDALERAKGTLGALISDKPPLSPALVSATFAHMHLIVCANNPELASVLQTFNEDALELIYIETMRKVHGDTLVNAALNDARNSYRTFYHSLQLRLLTASFDTSFDKLKAALYQLGAELGKQITSSIANAIDSNATNRAERRSMKHTRNGDKRLKESDQSWQRRNNPKRRR